jgi:hypothetical protein
MTFGEWVEAKEKKDTKYALSLKTGLPSGVGLELAYRLKPRFMARFSINYADLTINNYRFSVNSSSTIGGNGKQTVLIDFQSRMSHTSIGLDYFLKENGKFRAIGGFDIFPSNKITIGGELGDIIKFNDVSLNSDDLGSGTVTMGFKSKITPFLGFAFGNPFPDKRMSFGCEFGAQYKGNYTFDINIKEGVLLKKNEENAAVLERNFNKNWYQKIWPFLNLKFSFRLSKPENKEESVDYDTEDN